MGLGLGFGFDRGIGLASQSGGGGIPYGDSFAFTVDTTKEGSASNTFIIPTLDFKYDCTIDWGDGNIETVTADPISYDISHVYSTSGVYTIMITGIFPCIYFNNSGDKLKLISVDNWGTVEFSFMDNAFYGCSNLSSLSYGGIKGSTLADGLYETFRGCITLTSIPADLFKYCPLVCLLLI
jgi:hypothetical protein